jgi:uncharacterized membrane protein
VQKTAAEAINDTSQAMTKMANVTCRNNKHRLVQVAHYATEKLMLPQMIKNQWMQRRLPAALDTMPRQPKR